MSSVTTVRDLPRVYRKCGECGKRFMPRDYEQTRKWCGPDCRLKAYWRRKIAREDALRPQPPKAA